MGSTRMIQYEEEYDISKHREIQQRCSGAWYSGVQWFASLWPRSCTCSSSAWPRPCWPMIQPFQRLPGDHWNKLMTILSTSSPQTLRSSPIAFIIIPIRQLHLGIVSGLGVAVLTSVFTPVSGGQVIILDISLLQVPHTLCFNERANMTTAFKIFPKLWHFSNYSPKFSALTSNMSRLHPFASHLSSEGKFPRCLG